MHRGGCHHDNGKSKSWLSFRKKPKKKIVIEKLLVVQHQLSDTVSDLTKTNATQLEYLEIAQQNVERLHAKCQTAMDEIAKHNETIVTLQTKLEAARKSKATLTSEHKTLTVETADLQRRLVETDVGHAHLKKEHNRVSNRLEQTTDLLDKSKNTMETMRQLELSNNAVIQRLKGEKALLERDLQLTTDRVSELTARVKEDATMRSKLEAVTQELSELKIQRVETQAQYKNSVEFLQRAVNHLVKCNEQKKVLLNKVRAEKTELLTYIRDKSSAYEQKLHTTYNQLADVTGDRHRLATALASDQLETSENVETMQHLALSGESTTLERTLQLAKEISDTFTTDKVTAIAGLTSASSPSLMSMPESLGFHTKVMELEFRLYHRDKLMELLEDRIQTHEPTFTIVADDNYAAYLDPAFLQTYSKTSSQTCSEDSSLTLDAKSSDSNHTSSTSADMSSQDSDEQ